MCKPHHKVAALQIYGYQNLNVDNSSESLVRGTAMAQGAGDRPVVVGSKFFTISWTNFLLGGGLRMGAQSLSDALDGTLKGLGTDCVDLYQIHFPFPTYSQEV
jgi:aryl-alcohol dehydrogenase-like predicted oxidoreductase